MIMYKMNTRPQGLNVIENVAGNAEEQKQRKRIGRPPKIRQQSQQPQQQNDHSSDEMSMDIDNKISSSGIIDTNAIECRRSSRKKIIKFDVREVLNKNRKAHKVQIEARIDSNVIFNNMSSYSADFSQNSIMDKSDDENEHTVSSDMETTAPLIKIDVVKRGRPRLSLPAKAPSMAPETQLAKRGRGRPPKYRKDTIPTTISQIPEPTENIMPVISMSATTSTPTPVSVLLKKLKLSHGQSYRISGNSFESLNVETDNNKIISEVEEEEKVAIDDDDMVEVDEQEEEEEEENNIILELSSSSSSKTENIVNSSQSSIQSPLLLNMETNNDGRQRNFAAVSVLSRVETETPEFIVADVEEVEDQNDREIEYEIVHEETISDDSVILMLDLKDEETNNQHDLKSSPETVSSTELVVTHDILTQSQLDSSNIISMSENSEVLENTEENYNNDHESSLNSHISNAEDVRSIDDSLNSSFSSFHERNTTDTVDSVWGETNSTLEDMIVESDSLIEVIVMDEETEDEVELEEHYVENEEVIENTASENLSIKSDIVYEKVNEKLQEINGEIEKEETIDEKVNKHEKNWEIVEETTPITDWEISEPEENNAILLIDDKQKEIELEDQQQLELEPVNEEEVPNKGEESMIMEQISNVSSSLDADATNNICDEDNIIIYEKELDSMSNEIEEKNLTANIVGQILHENEEETNVNLPENENNFETAINIYLEDAHTKQESPIPDLPTEHEKECEPEQQLENINEQICKQASEEDIVDVESVTDIEEPSTSSIEKIPLLEQEKESTNDELVTQSEVKWSVENHIIVHQKPQSSIDMDEDFEVQIKLNHIIKPIEKEININISSTEKPLTELEQNSNSKQESNNISGKDATELCVEQENEKLCDVSSTTDLDNDKKIAPEFEQKDLCEKAKEEEPTKINNKTSDTCSMEVSNGTDEIETENNKTTDTFPINGKADNSAEIETKEINVETNDLQEAEVTNMPYVGPCDREQNGSQEKITLEESKSEHITEDEKLNIIETTSMIKCEKIVENYAEVATEPDKVNVDSLQVVTVQKELLEETKVSEKLETEEKIIIENAAATLLRRTNSHKNSPSPNTVQRKRIEKRYEYVPEAARPKTMEEIFAEIAAQSSKVVLEMAAVVKDDEKQEDIESFKPSEKRRSKSHELEQKSSDNDESRRSKSQDAVLNRETISNDNKVALPSTIKRRGRKPKQKSTLKTESTKDVKVLKTEENTEECKSNEPLKIEKINLKVETEKDVATLSIPTTAANENLKAEELIATDPEETEQEINVEIPDETVTKKLKRERKKSRWDAAPPDTSKEDKTQRQIELKEAFQAALSEVAKQSDNEKLENDNYKLDFNDKTLPLMLYKSMTAKLDKDKEKSLPNDSIDHDSISTNPITNTETKSAADPLSDIEKFIADGVNLLKRDYKVMDDISNSPLLEPQDQQQQQTKEEDQQLDLYENNTASINLQNSIEIEKEEESNSKTTIVSEIIVKDKLVLGKITFETPADTPFTTPTATPPPKSPNESHNYGATLESHGDDSAALRRSHRIKQITKTPKALVGRGLVREKERFALKSDLETKTSYSLDDHLLDLAQVEAKNAKFLKEMEERLSNFQVIKENEYKCERIVSKEARKMICDCFLTRDEEHRGELGCGEDCLNRLLMIECGPNCNVKDRCTNKRFQKYLCSPCRVFRTEKKGFGIMADIEILPGEFIMEYVGEVIDDDEFERRRTAYSKEKNRHYYFMALRSDAIIDATIKGNISRFINHSCDPNAETQKWTVNGELRIGFFSRKSIMPGEEITFDYQYQRYGREAQRCYCESSTCRGWIGEEPDSDEGEQPDEDSDEENLTAGLLADDDEQTDEGESEDPIEVQKKLEYAAAAAKLMPMADDIGKGERHKKKTDKIEDEDPTIKFRKLLSKISARVNKKKQKEHRGRGRPPKTPKLSDKTGLSPNKSRFVEDPDIEDEINFLRNCGLKNQSDTLSLSRLMVRAKLPQTRLNLLEVLRQGDEPCRRLFLDYHGLRLLHGWMSEDAKDMGIRLALLQTLMRLPIVNKTVLKDSKVLQTVRSWSTTVNSAENNSSPSDESSKESTNMCEANTATDVTDNVSDIQKEVQQLALKLCSIWDNLPEIFRIPKRERIEQMKEHEREADRQYEADLAEADVAKDTKDAEKTEDEHQSQHDRFRRDLNRFGKRPFSNREAYIPNPFRRRSGYDSDDTRHLSKEKRREMFAAKVAREEAEKSKAEERREFEIKCRFFGLNPRRTHPKDVPFCVNTTTGQWFALNRRPIQTPLNYIHAPPRPKVKSTDPNDYTLPPEAMRLPKEWRFSITPRGYIYYYHVKSRHVQWEPPSPAQLADCCQENAESTAKAVESTDDDEELLKDMDEVQFKKYMEKKILVRRQKRRCHLVTERPISPRREEDRLYNQQEVRKYKENKEKVRKRKEEIRRKRSDGTKSCSTAEDEFEANKKESSKTQENKADSTQPAALPIQAYLLSSDDDVEAEITANNSLLSKIVEGDKIVDELDALINRRRSLKRPFACLEDAEMSIPAASQLPKPKRDKESGNVQIKTKSKDKNMERYEQHKRRKSEKKEKDKEKEKEKEKSSHRSSNNSNSGTNSKELEAAQRRNKEKFRCEIAGVIVHYLKPYLRSSCPCARITSEEDFNHLARKLTHFVMIKELKYCESVGQKLVFTDSVKNKSKEFIKKYMAKYGETYKKPDNDPEFKDIPFTMKQNHEHKTEKNQQTEQH